MVEEREEYSPNWDDEQKMDPGTYIWSVHIAGAAFKDTERDKPYVKLDCVVFEGDNLGYKFSFRLYATKAARNWATYFLKKFGYPEELLTAEPPRLVRKSLEGLEGKILVEITDSDHGLMIDAKGFDRLTGQELEQKLLPKEEALLVGPEAPQEPSIDVFADVAQEQPAKDPFADLDNL